MRSFNNISISLIRTIAPIAKIRYKLYLMSLNLQNNQKPPQIHAAFHLVQGFIPLRITTKSPHAVRVKRNWPEPSMLSSASACMSSHTGLITQQCHTQQRNQSFSETVTRRLGLSPTTYPSQPHLTVHQVCSLEIKTPRDAELTEGRVLPKTVLEILFVAFTVSETRAGRLSSANTAALYTPVHLRFVKAKHFFLPAVAC